MCIVILSYIIYLHIKTCTDIDLYTRISIGKLVDLNVVVCRSIETSTRIYTIS